MKIGLNEAAALLGMIIAVGGVFSWWISRILQFRKEILELQLTYLDIKKRMEKAEEAMAQLAKDKLEELKHKLDKLE